MDIESLSTMAVIAPDPPTDRTYTSTPLGCR